MVGNFSFQILIRCFPGAQPGPRHSTVLGTRSRFLCNREPHKYFVSFAASAEQPCKCAFHLEPGADVKIRNCFSRRRSVISVASRAPQLQCSPPRRGNQESCGPGGAGGSSSQPLRTKASAATIKAAQLPVPTRGGGTGQTTTHTHSQNLCCC